MAEPDFGRATIVYEGPDGETVEETVENEHVAYFQDHWIVKTGEHEGDHDVVRRIPAQRVYFVQRDVEEFEEEVKTLFDDVQSLADGVSLEVRSLRDRVEAVADDLQKEILGLETDEPEVGDEGEVQRIEIQIDETEEEEDEGGSDVDRDETGMRADDELDETGESERGRVLDEDLDEDDVDDDE